MPLTARDDCTPHVQEKLDLTPGELDAMVKTHNFVEQLGRALPVFSGNKPMDELTEGAALVKPEPDLEAGLEGLGLHDDEGKVCHPTSHCSKPMRYTSCGGCGTHATRSQCMID
jgi:hypothetical protein